MAEIHAPSVLVSILLGRSGFGDSSSHIKDVVINNIHDLIYLGIGLRRNKYSVYSGRSGVKLYVMVSYKK